VAKTKTFTTPVGGLETPRVKQDLLPELNPEPSLNSPRRLHGTTSRPLGHAGFFSVLEDYIRRYKLIAILRLQQPTTTDTGTPHPEVPTTRQSAGDDAKGDTQNPQAASRPPPPLHQHRSRSTGQISENYQSSNQTVSTTNQRTQQAPLDGAHSTSPRMNITTAPAGRQGTKRRRRMEGSERVAADIDRVG